MPLPSNSRNLANKDRARSLRNAANLSETRFRRGLRRVCPEFTFRFQYPVGPYFLDFYCSAAMLCVEVDGEIHDEDRDRARDAYLAGLGVLTHRVPAIDLADPDRLAAHLAAVRNLCIERTSGAE
jgi:very-short-patch-repair endonuclease